jgi:glycosyltransferase involved in cell wall biosynthesis
MSLPATSVRPLISVLLPVLNPHPDFFPQAVASILSQTLGDLELLIVEDPAPRQAAAFLAEYSDSRIRHIRNPARTGLVQQLNQGLGEARGELVARMDADDVAEADRLQKQYELLRRQPDVAVTGSQLRIIDARGRHRGYRPYPLTHEAILAAMPRFNPLAHPSVMFRRDSVKNAGGYQYRLHNEDYELWSRLAVSGHRFANHPEPLLRYRIHAGSVKATRLRMMIRGTLQVKDRYWRDRMRWADRLRLLGERCLLALPAGLVMEMFKRTAYRPSLTSTRPSRAGADRSSAVGDP